MKNINSNYPKRRRNNSATVAAGWTLLNATALFVVSSGLSLSLRTLSYALTTSGNIYMGHASTNHHHRFPAARSGGVPTGFRKKKNNTFRSHGINRNALSVVGGDLSLENTMALHEKLDNDSDFDEDIVLKKEEGATYKLNTPYTEPISNGKVHPNVVTPTTTSTTTQHMSSESEPTVTFMTEGLELEKVDEYGMHKNGVVKNGAEQETTAPELDLTTNEQHHQQDDDKPIETSPPDISPPGVSQILTFAIPTMAKLLCVPFLSMVDTSAVGLLSGTSQQAALNPAVAVTEYATWLVAFMYTATTNLIASAQEADRNIPGKPLTATTLKAALQIAGYVGLALGTILLFFSKPLLKTMIGSNHSIEPAVFSAALNYIRIRALGMPAFVIVGSAQAGCIGMQDIKSPLIVLFAAAVVNFLGDLVFIPSANPLIGGAAGAAWAKIISQYAGLAMFVKWLRSKPEKNVVSTSEPKPDRENANVNGMKVDIMSPTNLLQDPSSKQHQLTSGRISSLTARMTQKLKSRRNNTADKPHPEARGFLSGKLRKRDLLSFPEPHTAKEFWQFFVPVFTTQLGRASSYVAMAHVVSSSIGTVGMAAQQVVLSFFYCLTPMAESLSLTAQSFVPGIFSSRKTPERAHALKHTCLNLMKTGALFGLMMLAAVMCIPWIGKCFTADPVVLHQVTAVAPFLASILLFYGIVCASEGILIGQKDLGFLGRAYAACFAVVPYFMLRVKKAAMSGSTIGLSSVWKVYLGYQLFRFTAWLTRLLILTKRAHNEVEVEDEQSSNRLSASSA